MLAAVANALLIAAILIHLGAFLMKRIVMVGALALASIALSGCLTTNLVKSVAQETPEQRVATIKALAAAGCKGSIDIRAGAGTAAGASPGYASGSFTFNGGCDPANAVVVPLRDIDKVLPAGGSFGGGGASADVPFRP